MTDPPPPPLIADLMRRALELARSARPSPNPQVGAVVVADGEVVGAGFHERPGQPHAEVIALEQAGERARGADLYVTLEPCCHQGRTPPCIEAIVSAGIRRIAVGMLDPDDRVNGEGARRLRAAGLEVELDLAGEECRQLLDGYVMHRRTGRPLVTLKAAVTLDARLATERGHSQWVSCEESRHRGHALRAAADAVAVGVETVLADDPQLTVRHVEGPSPTRVVLDSELRTPPSSKLVRGAVSTPLILAHTRGSPEAERRFADAPGVKLLGCEPTPEGRVSPADLLSRLGELGVLALLVEGGGQVHGGFIAAGLADRLALFVAPRILGSGRSWASFPGSETVADGPELTDLRAEPVGRDILLSGRFAHPDSSD